MRVRQYPNPFYAVTGLLIMVLSAALLVIGVLPQVSPGVLILLFHLLHLYDQVQ